MSNKHYYNYQYDIAKAMSGYNAKTQSKHFGLIDAHILSLIKSFYDNDQWFHMTNAEIAAIMLVSEATVKRSINKLFKFGLLKKEVVGETTFEGRTIVYCPNDFIAANNTIYGFKIDRNVTDKINNYNSVATQDKFSLVDISVMSLIASFSDNEQFFYMLNNTMQDILLVSQPTISKSIKLLEKYDIISVQRSTSSTRSIIVNNIL